MMLLCCFCEYYQQTTAALSGFSPSAVSLWSLRLLSSRVHAPVADSACLHAQPQDPGRLADTSEEEGPRTSWSETSSPESRAPRPSRLLLTPAPISRKVNHGLCGDVDASENMLCVESVIGRRWSVSPTSSRWDEMTASLPAQCKQELWIHDSLRTRASQPRPTKFTPEFILYVLTGNSSI